MASHINRGETLLIPFENGRSICDSQLRPRMYKTMQALEKSLPKHFRDTYKVEVVEYAEVKHGEWKFINQATNYLESPCGDTCHCSVCGFQIDVSETHFKRCPNCGAKMDGRSDT